MAEVKDVAEYLIAQEGSITNLRLNELLYYAQGMSIATTGEPLFDEEIQAWDCGPVVESVYLQYHNEFKNALILPQKKSVEDSLTKAEREILQRVLQRFGNCTGFELISLVQKFGTPWQRARAHGESIISLEEMQTYFTEKFSE